MITPLLFGEFGPVTEDANLPAVYLGMLGIRASRVNYFIALLIVPAPCNSPEIICARPVSRVVFASPIENPNCAAPDLLIASSSF